MSINYPQISIIGAEPKLRYIGIYSGTGVFTSSPTVRISGVAEQAQVIEVLENNSSTFQSDIRTVTSAQR